MMIKFNENSNGNSFKKTFLTLYNKILLWQKKFIKVENYLGKYSLNIKSEQLDNFLINETIPFQFMNNKIKN